MNLGPNFFFSMGGQIFSHKKWLKIAQNRILNSSSIVRKHIKKKSKCTLLVFFFFFFFKNWVYLMSFFNMINILRKTQPEKWHGRKKNQISKLIFFYGYWRVIFSFFFWLVTIYVQVKNIKKSRRVGSSFFFFRWPKY